MGARLGLGIGLGLGLSSVCASLEPTESPSQPSLATKHPVGLLSKDRKAKMDGESLDDLSPRIPSTSSPVRKLTLHTNHSLPLPHPALRHSDSWRQAFYVHHPDAQDEEEQHEVSELMVFAATFVLLHIAMCLVACGYWCLQMYRDFELRQNSQDSRLSDKRSKVS
mmetsp:Transcript_77160/g.170375  ORF Transcript_77160/g.170375 Transcript_77160/m.170375 type:complete len:166 (+) Transcript_77160:93-590(+)